MKSKAVWPILLFCLLLLSCVKEKKKIHSVDIKRVDHVTYVTNPPYPQNHTREYTLKEELTIGNEDDDRYIFVRIRDLDVDRRGNIYVLDNRVRQVKVFNKFGQYVRSFGRPGQGPGDFARPKDLAVDDHNKTVHILDSTNTKISRYGFDGSFKSDVKLDESFPQFFFFDPNGYYFISYSFSDEAGYQKCRMRKYTWAGELMPQSKEFIVYGSKIIEKGARVISGRLPFDFVRHFAFNQQGNICTGFSDKYEMVVLDSNFHSSMVIRKRNYELIKISQGEIDAYVDSLKEKENQRGRPYTWFLDYYEIPKYHEVFTGLWTDERDRLLVKTPSRDGQVHIDVFNREGIYTEKMIIGETSDGISPDEVFQNPVFKDGYIYSAVKNQDEALLVKRYRIVEKGKQ